MSAVTELWWEISRASGVVALVLACLSVIWGLLISSRYMAGVAKAAGLARMHKFLGGMTVIFTLIHVAALYLDSFVQFSVIDLLIPFASDWKPFPTALGIVSFWLLLAVQGTSMMMKRLPRRLWKFVHGTSYLLIAGGMWHGISAGTDAGTTWFKYGAAGLIGGITFLTAWRATQRPARQPVRAKRTSAVD